MYQGSVVNNGIFSTVSTLAAEKIVKWPVNGETFQKGEIKTS